MVPAKNSSPNTNDLYIHYMDKSTGTPPSLEEKRALPNCGSKEIYVLKNCISTSVATVLRCMKWLYPYVQVIGVWGWVFGWHHVSNILQLCDVYMKEWKRIPAKICAALVNSMPRRFKAVLDNKIGCPYKILTLWTQFWHVHLGCTRFCCQLFGQ